MARQASNAYKGTILVIGFVACLVADSSYNISGLFYAAHLEAFPDQTTLLGAVYGMTYGVGQLMSPAMALLLRSLGERRIAIGSSLCMFGGYAISFFATDARLLLLTFGLMVPVAAEGLYFFPMTLLAFNFNKRLTMASGVVASGCGTGLLISAPLAQLLITSVTWRGAALVLGAAALNAGALALLIRPRGPLGAATKTAAETTAAETTAAETTAAETTAAEKTAAEKTAAETTAAEKTAAEATAAETTAAEATAAETAADSGHSEKSLSDMVKICGPDTVLFYFAALLQTFSMVTVINFVPVMARGQLVPDTRIALYPASYGAAFTLGNLAFGYLGTRFEPFIVDAISLLISGLLTALLPTAMRHAELLGLAVYSGMGACQGGRYALVVGLLKIAVGLQFYEICTGLYVATFFFGSFPAPFAGQLMKRLYGSYGPAFYLAAAVFVAAGLATFAAWALQPQRRARSGRFERRAFELEDGAQGEPLVARALAS